ncbi:MAG: hypothetical protein HY909_28850 [Deltaproteobacteria bacterium]|nr:hypothetical protein [Deltaproteobacteria bacterium]
MASRQPVPASASSALPPLDAVASLAPDPTAPGPDGPPPPTIPVAPRMPEPRPMPLAGAPMPVHTTPPPVVTPPEVVPPPSRGSAVAVPATGLLALTAAVASLNARPVVCGSSRVDELAAHGPRALRSGGPAQALRELALAMGFADHTGGTQLPPDLEVRTAGAPPPMDLTPVPPVVTPPPSGTGPHRVPPRGGAMRVNPNRTTELVAPNTPPPRTPHRTPRHRTPPHISGGAPAVMPSNNDPLGGS